MTEKRFELAYEKGNWWAVRDGEITLWKEEVVGLLNELADENEQLKKDRFICLDCEHSGYTEMGCLCEKKDCWTEYKTECEDYEELECFVIFI